MIERFCVWLETLPWAVSISQSGWLFPSIETVHVLALTMVVGSIAMVDLRLLNLAYRDRTVRQLTEEVLPWTWMAFVVAAIFGTLLFASAATKYSSIASFQVKLVLLGLAGFNMLFFHFLPYRKVDEWGGLHQTTQTAKFCGGLSLLLWIGIVALGRWTGFA
ncbi:MAG: hypothetical protein M3N50_03715 [Pseudomonadota bacterium]|nr:hypothetical protein [Pseudomonadota bacterium]